MTQPYEGDDIDLADVIRMGAREAVGNLWTMLPCVVQSANPTLMTVDAVPVMTPLGPDPLKIPRPLPVLPSMPIHFFAAGGFIVQAPVLPGDRGVALISTLDFAAWFAQPNPAPVPGLPTESRRRQSLSDAVFVPGLHTATTAPTLTTGLKLGTQDGLSVVTVDPGLITLEALAIKLGATATSPLTQWAILAPFLQTLVDDVHRVANAVVGLVPGISAGLKTIPVAAGFPAVPPLDTPVPAAGTVKVTGE